MNFILLISTLFFLISSPPPTEGEFIIHVEGIKEVEGNIDLLVFNKNTGFPEKAEDAFMKLEVKVTSKAMKVNIGSLPFGNYAIALIHDVNANKELDKNMLGIPKEPFGFSNNKSIFFGLPNFEEAAVSFNSEYEETVIQLIAF